MPMQEIEQKLIELQNKKDAFLAAHKAKIGELTEELETARAEEKAAKIAEGLTDKERAALAQTIRPDGIASKEKVNGG